MLHRQNVTAHKIDRLVVVIQLGWSDLASHIKNIFDSGINKQKERGVIIVCSTVILHKSDDGEW